MSALARRGSRALLLSFALAALACFGAIAQEAGRLSLDQVVVSEDGEQVTALASVLDAGGRPVPGLTGFAAAIDGLPVPIESVEPVVSQETGIAALLIIDVSGSMQGESLAQAKAAATSFVEGLLAQDVAAVAPFADRPSEQVEFTGNRGVLFREITGLEAEVATGTALYDAVIEGLGTITGAPTERRAIVLLTDGRDEGGVSEHAGAEAREAARRAGLPIFAIGLGGGADVTFLQALAGEAGGRFYQAPTSADVPAIFDAIGARLRGQYALTLSLSPGERAERELEISIDLEGSTLTARASFRAPVTVIETEGAGGPPPLLWLVLIIAAVILSGSAGVVIFGWLRRRRAALADGPGGDTAVSIRATKSAQPVSAPSGRLVVVAGPNAGESVPLSSGPIDIGSDPSCSLRLEQADDTVAGTHARVWLQSGRLMLHHLARGKETLVGERPVEWATLEADDTLQIGPHIIRFSVDA